MLSYLYKPYPSIIEEGYRKSTIINVTVALVVFFILYVFKPSLFFSENVSYSFLDSILFAAITFGVSFTYTNILTRIFPKAFNTSSWTVGKEILMLFIILLSIAIANFFIGREVFYPNSSFNIVTLLKVILATFIVGVIPMIVVVTFYLYFHQNKNIESALAVNEHIHKKSNSIGETTYQLTGSGKYESIDLKLSNLLFIESIGNYCDIYYLENEQIKKVTFRSALASFVNTLPADAILKTHRSFIVNLSKVGKVTGNAQGYQLHLLGFDEKTIPVSRSNITTFDAYYK
ncbi:LytTR family DNA-binding domain-containing protein [Parvicella tangerina]|uniref:HTH LytTR-type domain-containing protein n=1 Tax=Parvicella tangerina TaxID=2829795 RepID=A0A916N803_9FLAO|nr:LytTR family DNA-binding domain-containing protein [Parvicella tangerina]CAG5076260.1 hypothetical protein CRYO30217_00014 [Parvicella tangerina]